MNKKSRQRDAIVTVLRSTVLHPTAEWIHEQVKKEIPNIGLATVYRNLRLLKEAGQVLEMHTSNDTARFDGNTSRHYHFCCDQCGKILDLDEPIDNSIEIRIAKRTGLKVTHHHLELGGLCLDCQKLEAHDDNRIE
ncbi:MAG: transcriptional repressor [Dehalococcoidales bacterium]|nr:transcriptional repressor [Dehalococcoidales bacterium]